MSSEVIDQKSGISKYICAGVVADINVIYVDRVGHYECIRMVVNVVGMKNSCGRCSEGGVHRWGFGLKVRWFCGWN